MTASAPTTGIPAAKKPRSSNLELYRIICMLMIVAHHYVVNSGLMEEGAPLLGHPDTWHTVFLWLFGMWGKTGINCFLMITGYFMCKSQITVKKYLKLLLQIYLYNWVIFIIFFLTGHQPLTTHSALQLILPFWGFTNNFTSCFIIFYLIIPFLTILVQHLSQRQHLLLVLVATGCYTLFGSIPSFEVTFNYITWFSIIYFIASYIRLYPAPIFERRSLWGWLTLLSVIGAMLSVVILQHSTFMVYQYVDDSNKLFALLVAFCSFIWFKNINIKQSAFINAVGSTCFGVLLIHANSDAMRVWLWNETVDCIGSYAMPMQQLVPYCIGVVIAIFAVCSLIDYLRIQCLEKPFFKWYDKRLDSRVNHFVNTKILGTTDND